MLHATTAVLTIAGIYTLYTRYILAIVWNTAVAAYKMFTSTQLTYFLRCGFPNLDRSIFNKL